MDLILNLDPFIIWFLVGIGLFLLELLTPGFVLACFGIGALVAIIPSLFELGLAWQLAFFSAGSLASLLFLRPIMMRRPPSESYPIGLEALRGREIRLSQDIPEGEYIEVPIDGDVWRVQMKDGSSAKRGDLVVICGRSGLVLYAKRSPNNLNQ